jgi:hydroxymethylpyrimidine pyrophosphatase-like HAD family hydrolase
VFVDLDGTLINGSTSSFELKRYIRIHGVKKSVTKFLQSRLFNRLKLKTWLSTQPTISDCAFDFNLDVIKILEKLGAMGYPMILATASPMASALRAAQQAPVDFEEILSSSRSVNLKGSKKLLAINKLLQQKDCTDFIYLGDAFVDLQIMKKANKSYFAGNLLIYLIGKHLLRIKSIHRVIRGDTLWS